MHPIFLNFVSILMLLILLFSIRTNKKIDRYNAIFDAFSESFFFFQFFPNESFVVVTSYKRNRAEHLNQTFKIVIKNNFSKVFHSQSSSSPPKKEKYSQIPYLHLVELLKSHTTNNYQILPTLFKFSRKI